jgi:translocation and assembly module TamB
MNTVYSFTSVWGLNYEFMEEDKPRRADFYPAAARYGGVPGRYDPGLHLLFNAANRWVPGLEIGQVTGGWRDLSL